MKAFCRSLGVLVGDTAKVRRPVHVLYYRIAQEGVIEIVRVLHEKMDPSRHLDEPPTEGDI
jgi:toxin ParE1/3/4